MTEMTKYDLRMLEEAGTKKPQKKSRKKKKTLKRNRKNWKP